MYPLALRQIDIAHALVVHDGGSEELRAEVVLVVDVPRLAIVGVVHHQRTHHRVTRLGRLLGLLKDVGHEAVAELPPTLHDGGNGGVVPRLTLERTVVAHV